MCNNNSRLSLDRRELIPVVLLCIAFFDLFMSSCVTRKKVLPLDYSLIKSPIGQSNIERPTPEETDSLVVIYGNNKKLIEEYADILITALSYYPELKDTRIIFEYSKEKTTMAARPCRLARRRTYKVLVNNSSSFDGIPFDIIPFNAAVGVVGHELAHIVDYERLTTIGLIDRLLLYSDKTFGNCNFEKRIDLMTINHGLGWQLYDWAEFAMYTNTVATEEYKEFKRRTYLTPSEIKCYLSHYSKYHRSISGNQEPDDNPSEVASN